MNRITMFEGYSDASRVSPSPAQTATRKRFSKCVKTCRPDGSKGFGSCMRSCLRPGSKTKKRTTKRRQYPRRSPRG